MGNNTSRFDFSLICGVPCMRIARSNKTDSSTQIGENAANEELGRKCVSMIAEERDSQPLRNWLNTGHLVETEMDYAHAYARLNISDQNIEDDLVITSYDLAIQDAPSQASVLKQALEAIAKHRNSSALINYCASGISNTQHRLSEWPVGLQNIGNTCYLNSLLQLFFTILPLRTLVLEFEDSSRMDITPANMDNKQVGSRKVSMREVERSQQCITQVLAPLFLRN
jgi:ubiquitin carboxyl-terminal hydrolase 25/28